MHVHVQSVLSPRMHKLVHRVALMINLHWITAYLWGAKSELTCHEQTFCLSVAKNPFFFGFECIAWSDAPSGRFGFLLVIVRLFVAEELTSDSWICHFVNAAKEDNVSGWFAPKIQVRRCRHSPIKLIALAFWPCAFQVKARLAMLLSVSGRSSPAPSYLSPSLPPPALRPPSSVLYVEARLAMLLSVERSSWPSTLLLVSITCTSEFSAFPQRPWFEYVVARLAILINVSRCSAPNIILLDCITRTSRLYNRSWVSSMLSALSIAISHRPSLTWNQCLIASITSSTFNISWSAPSRRSYSNR